MVITGGLAVALLARGPAGASGSAAAAPAPAARPPDLSAMTPREAFDRLFNRVMAAAEQGDTAEVARFAPMALLAYGNLPARDADARYHAAMLRLHTGDVSGAAALADTILAEAPGHLFGYAIRMTVAKFDRRATDLRRSGADLLAAWEAEMVAGRPEYADHRTMLDGLAAEARAAAGQR